MVFFWGFLITLHFLPITGAEIDRTPHGVRRHIFSLQAHFLGHNHIWETQIMDYNCKCKHFLFCLIFIHWRAKSYNNISKYDSRSTNSCRHIMCLQVHSEFYFEKLINVPAERRCTPWQLAGTFVPAGALMIYFLKTRYCACRCTPNLFYRI